MGATINKWIDNNRTNSLERTSANATGGAEINFTDQRYAT